MPSIEEIFSAKGVPTSIWAPILAIESGGNPRAHLLNGQEDSVGLFQLNRAGGLGTGYTVAQLADPTTNATIAANAMAPAYTLGVAKGLSGLDLLRYVAYNSGWPTQAGVKALTYDPVVQSYDKKLVLAATGNYSAASAGAGGTMAAGTVSSGAYTGVAAGDFSTDSKIAQIFFVVLGGALVLLGFKVITDVPVIVGG